MGVEREIPISQGRNVDRDCDMALRQSWLAAVDAIERKWGIEPRTSQLRRWYRAGSFLASHEEEQE